ncbi:MAG: hypothetical protein HW416_452 [Chloroflexi bacterium]|nr:hypothetical protein [Chloroflexota bacterium]
MSDTVDADRELAGPLTGRPPEAFVAWLWEGRHLLAPLATTDGRRLQVVYPGRRTGGWGPDFRGALLAIDGRLTRGDVEIHVHERDWAAHGHASDPAYGSIVLHTVYLAGSAAPATRLDGTVLPMVELSEWLEKPAADLYAEWAWAPHELPPVTPCRTPEEAAQLLDRAGLARFHSKAARFEADMEVADPAQVLWTGVLETLGFTWNVAPFHELSKRVTLNEAVGRTLEGPQELIESVLFGEAGLLPSQRGRLPMDEFTLDLERLWRSASRDRPRSGLGWRWVGCRPGNQPVRRVAAVAQIARAEAASPLGERVLSTLSELPTSRIPLALRTAFMVATPEYWQAHTDFARRSKQRTQLLGPERASDAVINAILPWAAAWAERNGVPLVGSAAEAAYLAHPALSANQITRHMERQIIGTNARGFARTACRQQGLIQIFHGWCDPRNCETCPAGPA